MSNSGWKIRQSSKEEVTFTMNFEGLVRLLMGSRQGNRGQLSAFRKRCSVKKKWDVE